MPQVHLSIVYSVASKRIVMPSGELVERSALFAIDESAQGDLRVRLVLLSNFGYLTPLLSCSEALGSIVGTRCGSVASRGNGLPPGLPPSYEPEVISGDPNAPGTPELWGGDVYRSG
jgi:hypothetical protein